MSTAAKTTGKGTQRSDGAARQGMTMLTRRQVAEMLSVSVKVVAEMAAARQGPPFCKLGDKRNSPVRYPAAQFHEWVESRMVACKSDA